MTSEVIIGRLNSDAGKLYAEALNSRALQEIAQWCDAATEALGNSGDPAEDADASLYYDAACLLRALAKHAK